MRKLILKTKFSVGDVVMMTAAVRDLHRCYPGQFITDVRTSFPELWENNPYLTFLDESDPEVEIFDCRYPLINHADSRPYHCLHGYIHFLNEKLNLQIVPTEFKGDIHLSMEEKEWASQVHELAGIDIPFWIVAAGGKHDITIKWWSTARYQEVVNHFLNRVAFVQIGEVGHHHPKLLHTVDLRGQTSIRELIRLVYHAEGSLCSVTALMHLTAAVEPKSGQSLSRPCVVIAGGREPPNWEAYPHHQYLHTVGMLPCCNQGGCWRERTVALGDGDDRDKAENVCCDVVNGLPHCMEMIAPGEVIHRIEQYLRAGAAHVLQKREVLAAKRAISTSSKNTYDQDSLNRYNVADTIDRSIRGLPAYPGNFEGRGIVICAGGLRYFPCAWVCIKMLRRVGCRLPIQLWYQGKEEMDATMVALLRGIGAECVDAVQMAKLHPRRVVGGWELKSYAILHSRFREVLLLDADNIPVRDPTFLFEAKEYRDTGSIFWPDYGRLGSEREIWGICGVPYRDEPEFESGQIFVHKEKCWRPLNLAFWMNNHSDFFYRYLHGDKDTFHLAWRKLEQPYTMVSTPIKSLDGIMCQHDLIGQRLFQHRNSHKWKVFARNKRVSGFRFERTCLQFVRELESCWDGHIHVELDGSREENGIVFRGGTYDQAVFEDVCYRNEYRLPEKFFADQIIIDVGAHIGSFSYTCLQRGAKRVIAFEADRENFRLAQHNLRAFGRRIRIHQKAVWRSDRHPTLLLHSGYPQANGSVNTGGGTVLLRDESSPGRKLELVPTVSLDRIIRPFKKVHLLKLDCEGSEWPILFSSRLLRKVERICGEYHELESIPTPALIEPYKRYGKNELEEFLRRLYKSVTIQPHEEDNLGLFWAEDPIAQ